MEFLMIVVAALVIVFVNQVINAKKQVEVVKNTPLNARAIGSTTATVAGGNYPLIGSKSRKVHVIVTSKEVAVVDATDNGTLKIPIECVKAQVLSKSAVSAAGIFLFGLLALGAKEKLLVLEIEDPVSKEHYTSVFKDVPDREAFSDLINRQHYIAVKNLKTKPYLEADKRQEIDEDSREAERSVNHSQKEEDFPIEVTDDNFEAEVSGSLQPVLVYVYADWAPPCRLMESTINNIYDMYTDNVKVVKVNADKSPALAAKLNVKSVPEVIIFHRGKIEKRITGLQSRDTIARLLDTLIL